jgi:hypothetical protein
MCGMSFRFRLLLPPLAALLLVLAVAPAAMAEEAPSSEAAAEASGETTEPTPMSVEFTRRRASIVGSRAVVFVRCTGTAAVTCDGTLALRGIRGSHKVPYSLQTGEEQALVVPLGDDSDSLPRGAKAHAVSRTLQLTGGTVRTSSVLRVR